MDTARTERDREDAEKLPPEYTLENFDHLTTKHYYALAVCFVVLSSGGIDAIRRE